ncbi:MAG TPA: hypothetical protein VFK38_10165 [Candidatus Limnocylindrales bacterium]|nr:hypothetical protein [Candidatus Limnocylindrales bacterium]
MPSPSGPSQVIGTAPEPPVETAAEAVEAVGLLDGRFLGYGPRRDDVIGQTSWVDVTGGPDLWTLVFTSGEGDCMAGCIDRSFAKFTVAGAGTVRRHCEWTQDEAPDGRPPC